MKGEGLWQHHGSLPAVILRDILPLECSAGGHAPEEPEGDPQGSILGVKLQKKPNCGPKPREGRTWCNAGVTQPSPLTTPKGQTDRQTDKCPQRAVSPLKVQCHSHQLSTAARTWLWVLVCTSTEPWAESALLGEGWAKTEERRGRRRREEEKKKEKEERRNSSWKGPAMILPSWGLIQAQTTSCPQTPAQQSGAQIITSPVRGAVLGGINPPEGCAGWDRAAPASFLLHHSLCGHLGFPGS